MRLLLDSLVFGQFSVVDNTIRKMEAKIADRTAVVSELKPQATVFQEDQSISGLVQDRIAEIQSDLKELRSWLDIITVDVMGVDGRSESTSALVVPWPKPHWVIHLCGLLSD